MASKLHGPVPEGASWLPKSPCGTSGLPSSTARTSADQTVAPAVRPSRTAALQGLRRRLPVLRAIAWWGPQGTVGGFKSSRGISWAKEIER